MKKLILLTLLASLVYGTPIVGTLGKPVKPFKKIVTKEKVHKRVCLVYRRVFSFDCT